MPIDTELEDFWKEHTTRLNRIIGMNLMVDRLLISEELINLGIWVDEQMEKLI